MDEFARNYLLSGLTGTPTVLEHLSTQISPEAWDRRPVENRFTLREIYAHMAEWDAVWLERLATALESDDPRFPDRDPGQMAIDNDYASADPSQCLDQFRVRRSELLQRLKGMSSGGWGRQGEHPERGTVTIEDLIVTALGHDAYHVAQIAEWIEHT